MTVGGMTQESKIEEQKASIAKRGKAASESPNLSFTNNEQGVALSESFRISPPARIIDYDPYASASWTAKP
jgi:hypothetical protein